VKCPDNVDCSDGNIHGTDPINAKQEWVFVDPA